MRQAARITLFVQDRDGRLEAFPDSEVLDALLRQVPLVNRNPDGSRTLVFDLVDPAAELGQRPMLEVPRVERLRWQITSLAQEARALGLPLTAALAESAELVAEAELVTKAPPPTRS